MEQALRIVTDINDFDLDFVFREIQNSYWAASRSQEANLLAIKNSLCFGLFLETKQIGFAHEGLQSVRWILRTKDAHSLYEQFGFQATWRPERYMEREAFEQGRDK